MVLARSMRWTVSTPGSGSESGSISLLISIGGWSPSWILPASHASNSDADCAPDSDPDTEAPSTGDLLCFSRLSSQVFGVQGFRDWLQRSYGGALPMHCDIVVSTAGNRARLVGGNVLQGVTLRVLPLNRLGRLWSLPRRAVGDAECGPDNAAACNFNRQDWVALLKLNPAANVPAPPLRSTPPACCVVCMLPMAPGMKRCPAQAAAPPAQSPVR
jgi:hypothetical protein